jgi:hypothetical protein
MAAKTRQNKTTDPTPRMGKLIGYARVSTTDQDLKVQREALRRAGVGVVFEEKASGTKRDGRTELQKVLSILGKGDALVVTRLDRLGRSLRDLANIAHEIEQAGAHLKVVEQSVDTSSAAGRAFFACWPPLRPSRRTSGASASWKASLWPSERVCTRAASRVSTGNASRSCRTLVLALQPLPANWEWPAARSIGFWGRQAKPPQDPERYVHRFATSLASQGHATASLDTRWQTRC